MNAKLFREYEEDGYQITEYTKDGSTVSHTIKAAITTTSIEKNFPTASIEEQILSENQYQTMLLELNMIGGF